MKCELFGTSRLNARVIKAAAICSLASMCGVAAHANDAAVDACIQEFVTTHLADYQGKVTVRKEAPSSMLPLPLTASTHRLVSVDAMHRGSGERLASVTCRVAKDGEVIAMESVYRSMKLARVKDETVAANATR